VGTRYDKIGVGYNQTRKADPYLSERLYHHLSPLQNGLYLDIGCGTGNYTIALSQKGLMIDGIDPSIEMLKVARSKNSKIKWLQATAEDVPVATQSIDGIICSLTIHHWHDLSSAFKELHRVLKPKGKVVIFTSTPEQMKGYWLNHYFPKMLQDSIQQMPSEEVVLSAMKDVGFSNIVTEQYNVKTDLQDLFLYAGKNYPKLYLDSQVRNGISSFSSLANSEEVETGLEKLEEDISSNEITKVIDWYSNEPGDYLYIIAEKRKK